MEPQGHNTAVVAPEDVSIEMVERPSYTKQIVRRTLYYTVGAIVEPQEPRYSLVCVFFTFCLAFAGGVLVKKCY